MTPSANDVVPQSATKNGANLEYTYTKNKLDTDVTFPDEWSDVLTSRRTAGVTTHLFNHTSSTQQNTGPRAQGGVDGAVAPGAAEAGGRASGRSRGAARDRPDRPAGRSERARREQIRAR